LRQIAAFLQLKWPLACGLIGTICFLAQSRLGLNWRTKAQAREIANTPNDLIKAPLDRKPTCMEISDKAHFAASGLFQMLPTELNVKILSLVAETHDLRPFSRTCQWATQFYHQQPELKQVLHLEGMPPLLLQSMRKKLGSQIFDTIKFMQCTSELLAKAKNNQNQFPIAPHEGKEKLKKEEEALTNTSEIVAKGDYFPNCLPTIQSVLAPSTFFITVNPDWLGNHKFLRTTTAAGTPAFIFVYTSNYRFPGSSYLFYQKDHPILILTQPSPYRPNEWGIVLQSWARETDCIAMTLIRDYLNSNHYLRVDFDQAGSVIPQCQAVWDWFMRFLEGQEVGFFYKKETFYPEDPQQRYFIQFKKV
jgi:hypothetical protein